MSSEEYPSRTFKRRDAASYDAVTNSFARLTERFTGPIAQRLAEVAELEPASRVLDVGTGTGIVALAAAERLGPTGRVVAIDLSTGMLETARLRTSEAELAATVDFVRVDAESLPLAATSFDAVLSLYALPHLPNPEIALAQMFRALRPGGMLVVGIGARPPTVSREGLSHALRRIPLLVRLRLGRWLAAPAFLDGLVRKHVAGGTGTEANSQQAHSHYMSAASLAKLVEAAGFVELRPGSVTRSSSVSSCDEFWEIQTTFSSFARTRIQDLPAEAVAAIRDEFDARCRAVRARGGRLTYPHGAYWIRARRPPV